MTYRPAWLTIKINIKVIFKILNFKELKYNQRLRLAFRNENDLKGKAKE